MTSFDDTELRAHEVTRIAQVYRIAGRAKIADGFDAEQAFMSDLCAPLMREHAAAWREALAVQVDGVTEEAKAKAAERMAEEAAQQASVLQEEADMAAAALSPDLISAQELEDMATAAMSPDRFSEAELEAMAAAAIRAGRSRT